MTTVQSKLHTCHRLATPIRDLMQEALDQAKDQGYDPHWINAILKAINDYDDAYARLYNIALCLDRRPVPARSHRH